VTFGSFAVLFSGGTIAGTFSLFNTIKGVLC
jgi:hypothetical protein